MSTVDARTRRPRGAGSRRFRFRCALVAVVLLALAAAGCGPRRVSLPSDPGAPLTDFAAVHGQVAAACAGVRTLTAVLGLSGRAGEERLGGRVIAGFERPSSMRLELVAPLGGPIFILAARGNAATLLLPRASRVVRNQSPDAILGALTGVNLAPGDLHAILTGCVVTAPRATGGRVHSNGMASIDVVSGDAAAKSVPATIFLQRSGGTWRVRAARRGGWQIDYPQWPGTLPAAVRLLSDSEPQVDLRATISELETNIDIDPAAFVADDKQAAPMTLEELRQMGPLRGN